MSEQTATQPRTFALGVEEMIEPEHVGCVVRIVTFTATASSAKRSVSEYVGVLAGYSYEHGTTYADESKGYIDAADVERISDPSGWGDFANTTSVFLEGGRAFRIGPHDSAQFTVFPRSS